MTLVDCKHLVQHLDDSKPEGVENEVCLPSPCAPWLRWASHGAPPRTTRCVVLGTHPHLQAEEQVAFADIILLNKCDLVDADGRKQVLSRIKVREAGPFEGAPCTRPCGTGTLRRWRRAACQSVSSVEAGLHAVTVQGLLWR